MAERLNSSNQGKLALGSSGVQASDPVGRQLGVSQRVLQETAEFMDVDTIRTAKSIAGEVYDERGFLSALDSETTASNKAKIQQAIYNINNNQFKNKAQVVELSGLGDEFFKFGENRDKDNLYKRGITADSYLDSDYESPERTQGKRSGWTYKGTPAAASALSDIPTSTTNWRRPRTVAAGYDYNPETDTGVITVVFRDGTFYNYYDIPPSVWIQFHDSFSKGPMLNRKTKNGGQAMDGKLLSYKHGPADMSNLSPTAQEFIYKVARTAQIYHRNKTATINQNTGRPSIGSGQNTRAKRTRDLNKAAKQGGYNPNRNAGKTRRP
jgi:hypothetical protein